MSAQGRPKREFRLGGSAAAKAQAWWGHTIHVAVLAGIACASLVAGCAIVPSAPIAGKPLPEFFDDLKSELRDVHWRVKSASAACGTTEPREVDLRNAQVSLDLQRIGTVGIDGQVRLVAIPLGSVAIVPYASASAGRKWTQDMALKFEVTGPARVYEVGEEAPGAGDVAKSVNAAIDAFMRSSAEPPCVRLTSLKLTLVIDVERGAGGGFKLVVPPADVGLDLARRDVNTLTLSWDKVVSNAVR
jgi:hypothetical protein